ncbi:hypothetical protein [Paenisporosarcina sp. OV554]|nr:hypothetical protein [Paenisporosarcina sp. OV554]PUB14593.1 hypothetical protein C8K15_105154 [Paenisporosarcina sp. OV554]
MKAIFFDLDGTLLNREYAEANADEVIDTLLEIVPIMKGSTVYELFRNDA